MPKYNKAVAKSRRAQIKPAVKRLMDEYQICLMEQAENCKTEVSSAEEIPSALLYRTFGQQTQWSEEDNVEFAQLGDWKIQFSGGPLQVSYKDQYLIECEDGLGDWNKCFCDTMAVSCASVGLPGNYEHFNFFNK